MLEVDAVVFWKAPGRRCPLLGKYLVCYNIIHKKPVFLDPLRPLLASTALGPHSRFGDKLLEFRMGCLFLYGALLKGLVRLSGVTY